MSGHLIDRPVYFASCPGCSRHVLAAISAGRTIAADIQAIDLATELTVRLQNRHTYDVVTIGHTVYLVYRDQFRITSRAHSVVGDHGCGALPRYQLIPPKGRPKRPAKAAAPDLLERIPF